MGMYEKFTSVIHRDGLTSSEVLIIEELDALSDSPVGQFIRKEGGSFINANIGNTGGTWGSIVGTLSNQIDLQSALNNLLPLTGGTLTGNLTISGLTASQILATDVSKNLVSLAVATYPSLTELSYIKGLTSAIQTQLNGKQATLTNSAGLLAALSDETGTGLAVFSTAPTLTNTLTLSSTSASPTLNLTNATATDTYDPIINFQTGASPAIRQSIWLDDSDSDKLKFGLTAGTPVLTLGTDGYTLFQIPDNSATAMEIKEATNSYLTFDTTNSAEKTIAGKDFEIGTIQVDANSGAVNFINMDITGTDAAGTEQSLSATIDGTVIATFYGEANGSGGLQNGAFLMPLALKHTGTLVGFYNVTPVVKGAGLTAQLTTLTYTAPGTPDYAVQDLTAIGGYGFVTKDEGNTVLSVIKNLQDRVAELEARLGSATGVGLFT